MLLARTAESVYWAGRYLERAEDMARIVLVHGDTHVDLPVGEDIGWAPLLEIAGVEHAYAQRHWGSRLTAEGQRGDIPAREAEVVEFLLFEDDNPSAVLASVSGAREALRLARPAVPARGVGAVQRPVAGARGAARRAADAATPGCGCCAASSPTASG